MNVMARKSFLSSSYSFIILWSLTQAISGRDLGICGHTTFNCQCGVEPKNYVFQIKIKECSRFFRWEHSCSACNNEKEEETCQPYKTCLECERDRCSSCPQGKFGQWCTNDCNCQNGGKCDRNDGSCTCPPQFIGRFCDERNVTECSAPESVANLVWSGTSYKVGDVITATCPEGYSIMGNKTRSCNKQGEWSTVAPYCETTCPLPKISAHLQAILNPGLTSKLVDAEGKEVIHEIGFLCEPGYLLDGPMRTRCQSTGKWDQEPPSCLPKLLCPQPGQVANGRVDISGAKGETLVPGTQLVVSCNDTHFLDGPSVISCTPSGTWSFALPRCLKKFGCPQPTVIENGKVEIAKPVFTSTTKASDKKSRIGLPLKIRGRGVVLVPVSTTAAPPLAPGFSDVNSRALYSCKSAFYRLIGASNRVCLSNGRWSGKEPKCEFLCGRAGDSKRPSIINGTASLAGRWPWQAGVSSRDEVGKAFSLQCGGSLISETLVLTAAHCVSDKSSSKAMSPQNFRIYLGKHFRYDELDDPDVTVFPVQAIMIHPNFHPRSLDSDIALIKLKRPAQFNHRISPVCLPQTTNRAWEDDLPLNVSGTVIGWGLDEDNFASDELKEVTLPVVNRQKCEDDYRGVNITVTLTTNMFCAGLEDGGTGTCKGDSGGPFMMESGSGNDAIWTQEGIVSFGGSKKCAAAKQYSGFLKVVNFVDWINQFK